MSEKPVQARADYLHTSHPQRENVKDGLQGGGRLAPQGRCRFDIGEKVCPSKGSRYLTAMTTCVGVKQCVILTHRSRFITTGRLILPFASGELCNQVALHLTALPLKQLGRLSAIKLSLPRRLFDYPSSCRIQRLHPPPLMVVRTTTAMLSQLLDRTTASSESSESGTAYHCHALPAELASMPMDAPGRSVSTVLMRCAG